MQVNIKNLIDDVQCYQTVRELRWPDGVVCPSCESKYVVKRGCDDTEPARQRYECHDCNKRFDDLTDTLRCGKVTPASEFARDAPSATFAVALVRVATIAGPFGQI